MPRFARPRRPSTHGAIRASFRGIALHLKRQKHRRMERATAGLNAQAAADKELTAELDRLKKQPEAKDADLSDLLVSAADQLQATDRPHQDEARQRVKSAVARANDPVRFEKEFRAKELTTPISQLIIQGEIPEALELYDQLFALTKRPTCKSKRRNSPPSGSRRTPNTNRPAITFSTPGEKYPTRRVFRVPPSR